MTDSSIPDLRTMTFAAKFHRTLDNPDAPGGKVDMWLLHDSMTGDGLVSIAVPHGREDIITFIVRSCVAGQRVMRQFRITDIENFKP